MWRMDVFFSAFPAKDMLCFAWAKSLKSFKKEKKMDLMLILIDWFILFRVK